MRRNIKRKIFFFFTTAFLVLGLSLVAPQNLSCHDEGFKYYKNYSVKEYKRSPRNWSVLQDKRGVIYIGNDSGVLEFDGVYWRAIDIPNNRARSLAIDDNGIIYVGGKNEIGFLTPVSKGSLQYKSLLDKLEDNKRKFGAVWRTHSTSEGIYFRTSKYLFRWNQVSGQFKIWEPEGKQFIASFSCNGKLFVQQEDIGLMHIVNNDLQLIPRGEIFKGVNIYIIAPHGTGHKMLIGTRSKGFYLYDGIKAVFDDFPTDVDKYIEEKRLSHGIGLPCGNFALATLGGGLVIIDSRGKLKQIFDKTSDLQDDNLKYVFEDSQGNLWLALSKGISKIEYASPFSIYDERSNLAGSVLSVTRHNNGLYAGTSSGLYSLASPGKSKFRTVPGVSGNCFSILSAGDSILAATTYGVFQVRKNIKQRIIKNPSYVLLPSQMKPNRIWVGTRQGLVSLYAKNKTGKWEEEHQFEKISQEIRSIVEENKGNLWLGIETGGVLKVDFAGNGVIKNPAVIPYHTSHGLPSGRVGVFLAAGHVMFATEKGIFRFEEKDKAFVPDHTLGDKFAGGEQGRDVFRIMEDKNKNIWLHSKSLSFQAIPQMDGTFVLKGKPFLRIRRALVNTIYPDPGGDITWFAGDDGLIRYDTRVKKNYDYDFSTFIRKVVVNGELIFDGYDSKTRSDSKSPIPTIEYKDRKNFYFEFAAPFFEKETWTLYRYFLEGYDDLWSGWSPKRDKNFTLLDSGLYTFRVQGKNVYENIKEAAFKFKILPPWYRTWWAYAVYIITSFLVLFLIIRWRSGKLQRDKHKLEQIVKDRTREIKDKNKQLEEQAEKLKEMDKVKSRFFANISHEFRTPLTLIMGPLEKMLSTCREKEQGRDFKLMLRNSQRLLGLINQLLELSRFDSGKMKLQACRQNIVSFLKGMLHSFDSLALQNDQVLTFHSEIKEIFLYFDPGKLEEVISNLLSNAVKFTPAGGKITLAVEVKKTKAKEEDFLEISVRDTGPGIPRDQLAHIFDRFYQADSTYEHHHKGSGIGLAITREIVELHHGTISAHSTRGENSGTEFVISLPMGEKHLEPGEIVESSLLPSYSKKHTEKVIRDLIGDEEKEDFKAEDAEKNGSVETGMEAGPWERKKHVILMVEDSADMRVYIRGALESLYTIVEAIDGEQGRQKAGEIVPDLIISDVMMPGMDGFDLCRQLKNDRITSHIPIILLTAKSGEENILVGLETGADDYIIKPFSTRILCARIKNLIDLRRHLQETLNREMTFQPAKINISPIDKEFLNELLAVINENISDPDFNVEQLGKKLYMSHSNLYRKIEAISGLSPTEFIRTYRLKRGAELLKNNFGTVLEVALEVGFSSANYFSKCFKKIFHQIPSEYGGTG
jgi:signal transduction histidine kinase/DNA-binding NarL/FixJ family response regulator